MTKKYKLAKETKTGFGTTRYCSKCGSLLNVTLTNGEGAFDHWSVGDNAPVYRSELFDYERFNPETGKENIFCVFRCPNLVMKLGWFCRGLNGHSFYSKEIRT